MAPDRDSQQIEEARAQVERAGTTVDVSPQVPASTAARSLRPADVLALQRQIGNAGVGRLLREQRGATAGGAQARGPAPELSPAPTQTVQRGFWGKVWGGIKHAASAVGSGIKTAATAVGSGIKTAATAVAGAVSTAADWVWDGAKKVGSWAVDWLSKAGSAVVDAIKWVGPRAWDIIKEVGTVVWEKLSLLGELAWDFVLLMPLRVIRLVVEQWESVYSALSRLIAGIGEGITWKWIKQGLIDAGFWAFDLLVQVFEVLGIVDALQLIWGLVFRTRELTEDEVNASKSVHGDDLIPYGKTRVDQHSYLVRLGKKLNQVFGDKNATERAITTFHIIHAPETLDIETAVHELTHVAQYEFVGAVYMPQALHGQTSEMGYNYGDLAKAHADGKHYRDFNREQQAQIAEDYYLVTHGRAGSYSGTADTLQPFIDEMRAGEF
ncbi:MAG: hypothetical protein ACXVVK_21755 [Solirubrobacteraceae bacterium]